MVNNHWLVVWNMTGLWLSHHIGNVIGPQLTNSYFSEGWWKTTNQHGLYRMEPPRKLSCLISDNYDLLPIKLNQFITGHHPVGPFFTAGKWVISDDCDGFWMCFGLDKHGDFLWKMMIFGRCFTGRWMECEGFPVWVARFPRIIAKLHLRNTRPGLQVNKKRWKDPPCYVAGKINYISMAIL